MIETARSVDVELEPNDISIAHGLPSNSQRQRNITVKFTRRVKRDEVFNARKNLKCKWTKDLPSVQIQSEFSSVIHNAAIHINESLIPYRKHLFSRILDLKKNHHLKYLWTSNARLCFVSLTPRLHSALFLSSNSTNAKIPYHTTANMVHNEEILQLSSLMETLIFDEYLDCSFHS